MNLNKNFQPIQCTSSDDINITQNGEILSRRFEDIYFFPKKGAEETEEIETEKKGREEREGEKQEAEKREKKEEKEKDQERRNSEYNPTDCLRIHCYY